METHVGLMDTHEETHECHQESSLMSVDMCIEPMQDSIHQAK